MSKPLYDQVQTFGLKPEIMRDIMLADEDEIIITSHTHKAARKNGGQKYPLAVLSIPNKKIQLEFRFDNCTVCKQAEAKMRNFVIDVKNGKLVSSQKPLDCIDCKKPISREFYMVQDPIWDSATQENERCDYLCIGCLEKRIDRILSAFDFSPAGINWHNIYPKSARLRNRLKRIEEHSTMDITTKTPLPVSPTERCFTPGGEKGTDVISGILESAVFTCTGPANADGSWPTTALFTIATDDGPVVTTEDPAKLFATEGACGDYLDSQAKPASEPATSATAETTDVAMPATTADTPVEGNSTSTAETAPTSESAPADPATEGQASTPAE